jgi:hypothetical protein
MCGKFARPGHDMNDQTANEFKGADFGRTATAQAASAQQRIDKLVREKLAEQSLEDSGGNSCMVSHPQLNGVVRSTVQVSNADYKEIMLSPFFRPHQHLEAIPNRRWA